jgi:hypothetical protein
MLSLTELPPALEGHPGMAAVRKEAETVLGKYLGPVVGMFVEAAARLINGSLPLRDEVKEMPARAFEALLKSESLQLQSENEPYSLLVAWLQQSPHMTDSARRAAIFKELAPLLRYHHMTPDFLANIVSQCPLMNDPGLLRSVMHAAFVQRDALPSLLKGKGVAEGSSNRGVAFSAARWEVKASFTLEEVAALQADENVIKWCGLVAGYEAGLSVQRWKDGDTLGAFLRISIPTPENALEGAPAAGVGLKFELTLSPDVKREFSHYFTGLGFGYRDFFDKPWAESVREGSPHFPGGKLEVKASVQLAVKG